MSARYLPLQITEVQGSAKTNKFNTIVRWRVLQSLLLRVTCEAHWVAGCKIIENFIVLFESVNTNEKRFELLTHTSASP